MKRLLSILCVLCLVMCMVPVMAIAADDGDLNLNFNSTDWSGNTEQLDDAGRLYIYGSPSIKHTLTYKTPLDLSSGDFAVTTYIHALTANSNRYGEYNALVLGNLELREYNDEYIDDEGKEVGVYTLKLFYRDTELASADMTSPNHYYTIVKQGNLIRVKLDNSYITLTDANGNTVNGVSASGMSFRACVVSIVLHGNHYKSRYAQGLVVDKNYTDVVETTDVSYPDESLYIMDLEAGKNVITYMNTATSIPTGTDNTLVTDYNVSGTYFASDLWQAVPMISQDLIDRGYIEGGEACQAIASVVTSSDGRLAMFGTDISGIYRSLDGGNHWQSCTIGFGAGGATGIAIDPVNPNHVIAVGCNTGATQSNGIYVTTNALDQCEWTKSLSAKEISGLNKAIKTQNDYRIQIVYDLNSYDATKGYCTTAYWAVEDVTLTSEGVEYPQQAMWKTTDGGFSWAKLENAVGTIYVDGVAQTSSAFLAGAEMASYTVGGTFYMYAATANGFYLSVDGGANWTETLNDYGVYANAIDVIETEVAGHDADAVGKVWITTNSAMYRSDDFGYTWNKIDGVYYPVYSSSYGGYTPDNISISSLNPDNIFVTQRNTNGMGWYSNNGGKSWTKSKQNKGQSDTWQPVTGVSPFGYWSNVYENTLCVNSNGMWKSIDAGETLEWSNSGYNAMAITGSWTFNVNNSNLIAVSAQDYNGGFSTDGGKTWNYLSWYGRGWGGHTYGAYMLDETTIIACDSDSWTGDRYLWITHDAGKTFINTGLLVKGLEAGMGCLGNDEIAFMGEWRTEDGGQTWKKMVADSSTGSLGCMGVLTLDYKTGTLFGANGNRVVYSVDNGLTWYQIANAGAKIGDIAYDYETGKIYVTGKRQLYTGYIDFNNANNRLTVVDYATEEGNASIASTVALDPNNPNVVYVGGNGDVNASSYDEGGVYRSLDGGETWTCLTRRISDGRDLCADGGKKAVRMRVNHATGELFVASGCRGMWKIAPPPQWYLDTLDGSDKVANKPIDHIGDIVDESRKDLIETGEYANYAGYTPKTVTLELISRAAGVEYGYFRVPDDVTIYVGDQIKYDCAFQGYWTMPNGKNYDRLLLNTTWIKGEWTGSKQASSNSSGYHTFSEPGFYTLYTLSSSGPDASGWALVSFYVADPYAGYTEISNASDLQKVKLNLNGNYVLTNDIKVSNWTSIGSETNSFNGVIYGNGYKISGLTAPLVANNNGGISHIEFEGDVNGAGMVAGINNSYIANCKVSGSVTGDNAGGVAGVNNGIVKSCVVDATVNGANVGAVAGVNTTETVETSEEVEVTDEEGNVTTETVVTTTTNVIGTVSGNYYAEGMNVVGGGQLADTDVNYTYTDINDKAQFDNLDGNWYQAEGTAPVLKVELGYTEQTFYDCFSDYVIKDGYLYIDYLGYPVDMLIGDYQYEFEGATIGAFAPDGTVLNGDEYLNTGDYFNMSWKGGSVTLKVVIVGDLMANGKVTAAGLEKLNLHILDVTALDGAFEMAGDLDGDGAVTSADALIYRQALLGLVEILA